MTGDEASHYFTQLISRTFSRYSQCSTKYADQGSCEENLPTISEHFKSIVNEQNTTKQDDVSIFFIVLELIDGHF